MASESMRWSASALRASSSTGAASPAISAASRSDWEDTPSTRLQVIPGLLLSFFSSSRLVFLVSASSYVPSRLG